MAEGMLGLSCSICLDLLRDPVTLLCGHSYCKLCINVCWNQEDQKGVYSCPQCRQTFTPRPVVGKNIALAEIVETLKKTRLHHCSAGPEDVECDSCTEGKHKAVKSCLVCLASFCETHLQPHYKSPAFKKHKLVEASRRLQEQICSQHDKLLEVYCRTDQQCICMLCTMDDHKGHDTVSAAAARAEKQNQLLEIQEKSKQRIQEREKELQGLRKAVETHTHSAQRTVQETGRIFAELIKSIEARWSEATKLIRAQEKAAVSRAEEVSRKLEQEIAKMKKRDAEMEELSHTQNPIQYLQSFKSVSSSPEPSDLPTITLCPRLTFENIIQSVSQLKEYVEKQSNAELKKISEGVREVHILPPPPPPRPLPTFQCALSFAPPTSVPQKKNSQIKVTTKKKNYSDAQKKAFQFPATPQKLPTSESLLQFTVTPQKVSSSDPQKKESQFTVTAQKVSSSDPQKKESQCGFSIKPPTSVHQKKDSQIPATPQKLPTSESLLQFFVNLQNRPSSPPLKKPFQ